MEIVFNDYNTEHGTLRIGQTGGAVCFCFFTHGPDSAARVASWLGAGLKRGVTPLLELAASQTCEYLAGQRRKFDYPVILVGSDFRKRVWQELMKVDYGDTVSYGELARRLGRPSAARAVGGAVGANPLFAVVPCHRVVASRGAGGFAWGACLKTRLLQMESSCGSL